MNRNCSPSAIGRRIADLRREVGLTQGELVEKADISVVHLSNIELGKKTPGLSTLIRIAEALDVATDWILRANTPRHIRRGKRENRRVARRLHE